MNEGSPFLFKSQWLTTCRHSTDRGGSKTHMRCAPRALGLRPGP